ncbi:MAG: ABC transporter ATP-binding protein [Anaerolineae bacterium]|jgi:ABC-2 type transport system ATP-binding protein|nr:ABC transporter ATP-binding protein [Anaerolineae bacterium]
MNEVIIQTEQLSKRYGAQLALNQLNLSVQRGEIFGYLGPNGAGKTTTIRILLDLIRPSQGKATIFGLNSQADSVALHHRIGFMPGELNLWPNQLGRNIVRYMASVRGNVDMRYVGELVERLQLDLNKRMRDYSTGNKRKLGLILALMHKPDLLILDEPTSGLDPLMQQIFNELMRECREAGRTVFLSSHLLSEVQAICDRVGILRGGELKAVETVSKLTHADFRWVTIEFRDRPMLSNLGTIAGVQDLTVNDHTVKLRLFGDFDPLLRAVSDQYVVNLKINEPTLEEIFLAFYGEQRQLV